MKPMWNNRNLRLLVLSQASSLVGNYTLKFALSMYILEVTGSAALFATFLSVAMVPTIVLSPFGGILADRGDRRRIMVTLDACAGLAVLLAAMFFQAFEGPEISGWISWLLLGIVIGNLFLSLAMHCWLQRKM